MSDDAELYNDMQEEWFWDWVDRQSGKVLKENNENSVQKECVTKAYERYFFVDYENVNRDGLNGVSNLTVKDCVKIYYSEAANTLTFGLHRRINASKANFEYIKVQMPIKNAVDCQILFDLRDICKVNRTAEFFIVSKDSDFDEAIQAFNARKIVVKKLGEICKRSSVDEKKSVPNNVRPDAVANNNGQSARQKSVRDFVRKKLIKEEYQKHLDDIVNIILTSKTRNDINNRLSRIYKTQVVGEIYKIIKVIIKDLPGK